MCLSIATFNFNFLLFCLLRGHQNRKQINRQTNLLAESQEGGENTRNVCSFLIRAHETKKRDYIRESTNRRQSYEETATAFNFKPYDAVQHVRKHSVGPAICQTFYLEDPSSFDEYSFVYFNLVNCSLLKSIMHHYRQLHFLIE